jgi:UDP-N-acetylglucosamine/UDP-N-acetylgalactosamine diphosphorylase
MKTADSASPLPDRFRAAGQGGVFAFLDRLDPAQRAELLAQAAEIDLAEVARLHRTLVAEAGAGGTGLVGLEPAREVPLPAHGGDAAAWTRAEAAGREALRAGRVAAFTVAGGQGTRLGFDGPKGTFPVTPVRGATLFQVFAEKILAAGRRAGRPLHWFIMTSHQNHAATEAFFAGHHWFGLDRGRVHFLRQGRMPAVDFAGRILLESPGSIALSPDGHGGSLRALDRSGALDLMRAEGVDTISYFQVDNPLVRAVDPAFLGWHLLSGSEMSSKMVPKTDPAEKVGLFCRRDGRLGVAEYSDLPAETQREREADGRLRFRAANIALHVLDREFVRRMAAEGGLPFHRADKKIPTVDAAGRSVTPDKPNGVKFELFVFDALPFARNPLLLETSRADDFSPVKNATGADSPQTARDDQLRQWARWLRAAGADLPVDATGRPAVTLEVSPLFADDAAAFAEAWKKLSPPPSIRDGLVLPASS